MIIGTILLSRIVLLIFPVMLFFLCYLQKIHSSEWATPSIMFGVFWAVMMTIALLMPVPVPIALIGIFILFIHIVVFLLPGFFFRWRTAFHLKRVGPAPRFDTGRSRMFLWIFFFTTLVALVLNLHANGIFLNSYIKNPAAASQHFIALRYSKTAVNTIWNHISRMCVFMLFVVFPFAYDFKTKKGLKRLLLVFMLPLLFVILYGDKGTILLCVAVFYGSSVGYNVLMGRYQLLLGLNLKRVMSVIIGFVCLICLMLYLRYGSVSGISAHVFAYAGGWLYAFSDWVYHYYFGLSNLSFTYYSTAYHDIGSYGILTYLPLAKLLGFNIHLPSGLYSEYPTYHGILIGNIFTIFRGTITDFGLLGSLIYIFLVSFICNMSFYMLLVNRVSGFCFGVFVVFIMWTYTSYLCSIFIWNSPYVLFFLIALTVNLLKDRARSSKVSEV